MSDREYWVYILTNVSNSVLYIGVTNNIERRLHEHRNGLDDGFTKKYHLTKLVRCEPTNDITVAIAREKELKGWNRARKNFLIESENPTWKELLS